MNNHDFKATILPLVETKSWRSICDVIEDEMSYAGVSGTLWNCEQLSDDLVWLFLALASGGLPNEEVRFVIWRFLDSEWQRICPSRQLDVSLAAVHFIGNIETAEAETYYLAAELSTRSRTTLQFVECVFGTYVVCEAQTSQVYLAFIVSTLLGRQLEPALMDRITSIRRYMLEAKMPHIDREFGISRD